MSKYISQYTAQTATQSTDKYLFQRGLTYYHITNANLVTSLTSSLNLAQYLTIASAASTYVPLTRELTINGVTHDLSANRSWTIPTGGNETLAQTLALGNTSGAYDILMNTTKRIGFKDGDNINTSYISNNQTASSATMYLPHYDGRAVIHATGTSLTSGRVPYVTTNGLIADSANFVWDNSNVRLGIGTASPSYFVTIEKNVNDFPYHLVIANNSAGTSAASSLRINTDVNGMEFGVLNSGNTIYSTYGSANDAFLRYNPSASYQGNVNFLLSPNASTTKAFRFFVSQNAGSNYRLAIDKDGVLVKGSTSDSSAYYLKGDDSSSAARFYGRNDGAHAINSSSLVSTAALKIKGRLIVSTQEVTGNDSYNAMIEVGVGNGVLFSDGTNGATTNNQLGYIFGDGGLQIYGRNNASATKFFFSGKASANRYEFYSDDANTHFKMTSTGVINYTHAVNNDGFNVIRSNAATTTASAYSAISVINADATANRVSVIGFTHQANVARHAFIGARYIDSSNGDLILGNKGGGSEKIGITYTSTDNVVLGNQAAISTSATDGFLYVPSCAGTPTGTPTAYTGKIAVVADSTNNKLYIYSGGAWVALN